MPKGSAKLTNARKEEIIDACASLYETMSFRDITLRDISARTSFTRTSIYNYFQTKEEIILGLLQREYEAWTADLEALLSRSCSAPDDFACELARTLEKRGTMLKLLSMNLYDMEGNSRLENLTEFKKAYAACLCAISSCLEKFFPQMTPDNIQDFIYAFLPFIFGIYPYTTATEKQRAAMEAAQMDYVPYSIFALTRSFAVRLLKSFS